MSDSQLPIYDEFDLRPYVEATQRRWYLIIGLALLLAVAGFTYTTLTDALYESVALLRVAGPSRELQFDSRIRSVDEEQPIEALVDLALSEVVLLELRQVSEELGDLSITEDELYDAVNVTPGSEQTLLRFTVRHADRDTSLALVEYWIDIFLVQAEAVYGNRSVESLLFFSDQRDASASALEAAEQALIEFQRTNARNNLEIRLNALKLAQSELLLRQQNTMNVERDLNALSRHLALNLDDPLLMADRLTALFLQLQAFGGDLTTAQIQLQLGTDSEIENLDRAAQLALLEDLQTVLATQQSTLETELAQLETTTVELQGRLATLLSEENRLIRERDIAAETYTAISRKVEEERISAQDTSNLVELIGKPVLLDKPIEDSRLLTTAGGAMSGVIFSLIIIWGTVWWQSITRQESDSAEPAKADSS